jgi:hypothetical protein
MDYDKAQRLIVLATIVTLGSTTANVLKKPKNQKESLKAHRVIAGGFFAMAICAFITEADTTIGVGLAALVAGGAFFKYGLPVLDESFTTKKEKHESK